MGRPEGGQAVYCFICSPTPSALAGTSPKWDDEVLTIFEIIVIVSFG